MIPAEARVAFWEQTGGKNPLGTYETVQDAITYGRSSPHSGIAQPPYDAACMDERILGNKHTIRAGGAGAFSETTRAGLRVIAHQIAVFRSHHGCGKASKYAEANGHPTEPDAVNALAVREAAALATELSAQHKQSRMQPPPIHIAIGIVLDATPYGINPATMKSRTGQPLLPPMLTISGGVLGAGTAEEDGPLAGAVATGKNSLGEFFTPDAPLLVAVVFDSSQHTSKLTPDNAHDIAQRITHNHPEIPMEIQTVDMNARPSTRTIIT